MSETPHVHDCTGPDLTCQCGYRLQIARFAFNVSVYDNATKQPIVDLCFMTDHSAVIADALETAARKIRGMSR